MNVSKNWFLAQLRPNGLALAIQNLSRQGFEAFMPAREISVRSKHGQVTKQQPIFPGYVFVGLDTKNTGLGAINGTRGISRLVTFGQQAPQPLPEELILGLKARCDENNCFLPPNDLKAGERVRAISGPFVDFIAQIESVPDETRVGVLFEIMGRSVRTVMPRTGVERVGK